MAKILVLKLKQNKINSFFNMKINQHFHIDAESQYVDNWWILNTLTIPRQKCETFNLIALNQNCSLKCKTIK